MTAKSQRDAYIRFIKATQAYIAAADALSLVSFSFPIDPEGNEIPNRKYELYSLTVEEIKIVKDE